MTRLPLHWAATFFGELASTPMFKFDWHSLVETCDESTRRKVRPYAKDKRTALHRLRRMDRESYLLSLSTVMGFPVPDSCRYLAFHSLVHIIPQNSFGSSPHYDQGARELGLLLLPRLGKLVTHQFWSLGLQDNVKLVRKLANVMPKGQILWPITTGFDHKVFGGLPM